MTKDNIIVAALRLFLLRGYRNVSLMDVANEIGITKGGIYHYFGSKEELFRASIGYLFDYFGGRYTEFLSKEKTFRGTLNLLLSGEQDAYMEGLLNIKPGDYRANNASLALEIMHNFPEIQEQIDQGQLRLRNIIKEKLQAAQETGETRGDLDAKVVATIVLSVSSGLNVLGKNIINPDMHQQMIDSLWQLIGVNDVKE
ncbi:MULTISPECIES: TetR/AcrR family transcriptional regulator [Pelosinus]|uniref:Regulatory protein TetR n=1 Tax=Pelosinus fermentans B4 TaxID=1149862 RepID=I9LF06_9FIRM|nr:MULTISPECIES: TetR/AcrR family transcriptional regulator [Pelosinus]EIW18931.1 regulatory protein TetR [Pelosinus fermentans B4]EIW21858.1 transcriptional regulator, TetR family [Pelosinus fermentans A11]OAM95291.1 transcriptional regulator, TetR family [Pelosinus fermentans DSM 17108]SDR25988.1 DNA-binding transcriptional regulator, AcrR family [Pelosinus fermentans]